MKPIANSFASMEIFITVAESQNFTEAGHRLSLSQPSISRHVSTLEQTLGVRLFQRTTRSINLTEAGIYYLEKARKIRKELYETNASMLSFQDAPAGKLRVGTSPLLFEYQIADHLPAFFEKYPDIHLDIQTKNRPLDLVEESYDLTIRMGSAKTSDYIIRSLSKNNLVVCATKKYLNSKGRPEKPADLCKHNCLIYNNLKTWGFASKNSMEEVKVNGNVNTNQAITLLQLLKKNHGIALLPGWLLNNYINDSEVEIILTDYRADYTQMPLSNIYALYPNRKHVPKKVRVFLDFLIEIYAA